MSDVFFATDRAVLTPRQQRELAPIVRTYNISTSEALTLYLHTRGDLAMLRVAAQAVHNGISSSDVQMMLVQGNATPDALASALIARFPVLEGRLQ